MLDPAYLEALVGAGLVMPDGYFSGSTVWRERGLVAVDLLVDAYLRRLGEFSRPELSEHPFLMPEPPYRQVFPDYRNVYTTQGGVLPGHVLRPDNLQASVRQLTEAGGDGPLVAVGGLLRHFRGPVQPLFRERCIWPAVQTTHLVPHGEAVTVLDLHQRALEAFLSDLALPVISVSTDALSDYGPLCYLTVGCLPDGRPTVLSTSYVMSPGRCAALGVPGAVLDIGFTGKLLALVAAHHRDEHGLVLPSRVAPAQVGVTVPVGSGDEVLEAWLKEADAAGTRLETVPLPQATRHRRRRSERRRLRTGAPVVVTACPAADGSTAPVTVTRRLPLERVRPDTLPSSAELRAELAASDDRLRRRADHRFRRALLESGLLPTLCTPCVESRRVSVFGRVTPARPGPCSLCGRPGEAVLVSEGGRFY
ncbi:hypothetical protein [Streptomyces anulatus]|uniref:hypothetical protein n=1 Tax=Streptomyces anulatus TaxID=1892 RepID=UPI001C275A83|nr:hypothetical protein [Streptomyces anulatus]